jgi:glutathione reductase (NADPH)
LIYRGPLFMRGFDDSVRKFVKEEIVKKGVKLLFDTNVESIELDQGVRRLRLSTGDELQAETVLYATGRAPNTLDLDLPSAGVTCGSNGAVIVDDDYRTNVDHIYAIGDVTDRIQHTPVAIEEGMCIANNLFTDRPRRRLDYRNGPTAVFCQPNIGTVGLTEAQAVADHAGDLNIYESSFKPMKHTLTGRDERTYMKMIVRRSSDSVLGIHMVGPEAGEIIQGMAVAMAARATKAQFDATVGIHPTAAEELVTMRDVTREA